MAEVTVSKVTLLKQGTKLGLSADTIGQWLDKFGPSIVQLLLGILQGVATKPMGKRVSKATLDFGNLKSLLVNLLVSKRDIIVSWIESGETTILDALIAIVGSKSAFVAALLSQEKAKLDLDTQTEEAFDKIVKMLS